MKERLFNEVDTLYGKYVKMLEDVCNIESPTAYKAGVDAVGRFFSDEAKAHGWKIEVFPHNLSGDVICITMNPDAKGKPIALSGHMDTVHPLGLFGTPAVRIEGNKIYGPGVTDCKGGIVAGFMAMEALERCGYKERPIQMLLQSDEEGGSYASNKATIGYICEKSADAEAFLNLEPHTAGKICIGRKGIVTFTFKIKGIEAHSSSCAVAGANAICEAAHKIIELEKLKDAAGLTCNCGVISGGSVANTVPGYCEFKANIRFATAEQLEWVRNHVQEVADNIHVNGCTCEVVQTGFRVAMEKKERNLALADKINSILEKVGMETLEKVSGSGGSDAADVTVYGKVPCVDCLGISGGRIHSPDEFALLDSLPEMGKRLAAIIYYF